MGGLAGAGSPVPSSLTSSQAPAQPCLSFGGRRRFCCTSCTTFTTSREASMRPGPRSNSIPPMGTVDWGVSKFSRRFAAPATCQALSWPSGTLSDLDGSSPSWISQPVSRDKSEGCPECCDPRGGCLGRLWWEGPWSWAFKDREGGTMLGRRNKVNKSLKAREDTCGTSGDRQAVGYDWRGHVAPR